MKTATECFRASEEQAGERLDALLAQVLRVSRVWARELLARGLVRVNGRAARKGQAVGQGDVVEIERVEPPHEAPAAPDSQLDLHVVFEDADFVAVDKPAHVAAHPLKTGELGTIANALVARYPEMARVGFSPREPGLVHRLDTDTSGLLLAARNNKTFDALRNAFARDRIDKRYTALCAGAVHAPQVIERPLGPERRGQRRVVVSQSATATVRRTELLGSETFPTAAELSLVEARMTRGYRHQIRVHLADIGHPLAGDVLYGGPTLSDLHRHFLHASRISFAHPTTLRDLVIESSLPNDLSSVLGRLRISSRFREPD